LYEPAVVDLQIQQVNIPKTLSGAERPLYPQACSFVMRDPRSIDGIGFWIVFQNTLLAISLIATSDFVSMT
jgi:hypothetical protein